jgi:general stress protein YciG
MANNENQDRGSDSMEENTQTASQGGSADEGGSTKKSERGFAAMPKEQQRAIASKGGKAAHAKGTAHEFTSEEARAAGKKGGEAVSENRQHMSEIGRKGGEKRGKQRSQGS